MSTKVIICRWTAALLLAAAPLVSRAANWPSWRGGPEGSGFTTETDLPTRWDKVTKKNILWDTKLSVPGNSTPVVWGDRVFLTQASWEKQSGTTGENQTEEYQMVLSLLCFDRANGEQRWRRDVRVEKPDNKNPHFGYAPASPATDGQRVIVSYGSSGLYCYSMEGKDIWHHEFLPLEHPFGPIASPVLCDIKKGGEELNLCIQYHGPGKHSHLIALDRKDGTAVWQVDDQDHRPANRKGMPSGKGVNMVGGSFATPIVIHSDGRDQLIMSFPGSVRSFDPSNGVEIWRCGGLGDKIYSSPLFDEQTGRVIVMSSERGPSFAVPAPAVPPATSGDITDWLRMSYKPSHIGDVGTGVIKDNHLYYLDSDGRVFCVELNKGRTVWEPVLHRPHEPSRHYGAWSSLLMSGKHIYGITNQGNTVVFKAEPGRNRKFQSVADNELNEPCHASLAASDGDLFIRTHKTLYCIREIEEPEEEPGLQSPPGQVPRAWVETHQFKDGPLVPLLTEQYFDQVSPGSLAGKWPAGIRPGKAIKGIHGAVELGLKAKQAIGFFLFNSAHKEGREPVGWLHMEEATKAELHPDGLLEKKGPSLIDTLRGLFLLKKAKGSPAEWTIESPQLTMSVGGTEVVAFANEQGTLVTVPEGRVEFTTLTGSSGTLPLDATHDWLAAGTNPQPWDSGNRKHQALAATHFAGFNAGNWHTQFHYLPGPADWLIADFDLKNNPNVIGFARGRCGFQWVQESRDENQKPTYKIKTQEEKNRAIMIDQKKMNWRKNWFWPFPYLYLYFPPTDISRYPYLTLDLRYTEDPPKGKWDKLLVYLGAHNAPNPASHLVVDLDAAGIREATGGREWSRLEIALPGRSRPPAGPVLADTLYLRVISDRDYDLDLAKWNDQVVQFDNVMLQQSPGIHPFRRSGQHRVPLSSEPQFYTKPLNIILHDPLPKDDGKMEMKDESVLKLLEKADEE